MKINLSGKHFLSLSLSGNKITKLLSFDLMNYMHENWNFILISV